MHLGLIMDVINVCELFWHKCVYRSKRLLFVQRLLEIEKR